MSLGLPEFDETFYGAIELDWVLEYQGDATRVRDCLQLRTALMALTISTIARPRPKASMTMAGQ